MYPSSQHDPELGPKQEHTFTGDYNIWWGVGPCRQSDKILQEEGAYFVPGALFFNPTPTQKNTEFTFFEAPMR